MVEKVLVFDKEYMAEFYGLPGITKDLGSISALFRTCLPHSYFVDRDRAEIDESIVQIIPYVVIQSKVSFATYRRTSKGGEDRLHNKFSIGLGGHVNAGDLISALGSPKNLPDNPRSCQEIAFFLAMERELREEVSIKDYDVIAKPRMLIYDDKDAVGRVHLGVVLQASLKNHIEVSAAEEEIGDFAWRTRSQLQKMKDQLESWSQLCLENI